MIVENYLVISSKGASRITKTPPKLDSNEVVIHLKLNIPNVIFQKPQLSASITLQESQIQQVEVNAEMLDNLKVLAAQNLGIDLTIIPPVEI